MIKKFRDISIIDIGKETLAVACDGSAGIGALDQDIVSSDGFIVGYYSAFVPLVEILAVGGIPLTLINTLSVAKDDYGQSIIDGMKKAAIEAQMLEESMVTGSTEENFSIPFTSVGVTVIGKLTKVALPKPIQEPVDIYILGMPMVGEEVIKNKEMIVNMKSIMKLRKRKEVVDILPVGSKGIHYELLEMEQTLCANAKLEAHIKVDMKKSAGPATCAIIAVEKDAEYIFKNIKIPVMKIGRFIPVSS